MNKKLKHIKIWKIENGVFGSDTDIKAQYRCSQMQEQIDALAFLPLLEILPGAQILKTFLNEKLAPSVNTGLQ